MPMAVFSLNDKDSIAPVSYTHLDVYKRQQEYVTAAKALGASGGRIIRRHLLPNCIGQIVVTTCLQIPSAIFLESFLSYLGVGVSAPLPSLGSMATDALSGMYTYTYRLIIPAIVLSVMILAFNL